jgi:acyl-lipid omega-6 desaturase (Delta-12 desaturase)
MALNVIATHTEPLILQPPILARSLAQLTTSFGGFFATCAAMYVRCGKQGERSPHLDCRAIMYACFEVSAWIALPLSIVVAGFLVRIFIIQHDCGHGSFFKSRRANDLIGIGAA